MNLPNRRRLGAAVLIISGIAAFIAPFLIHSPPTAGGSGKGPGTTDTTDTIDTGGTTPPPSVSTPPPGTECGEHKGGKHKTGEHKTGEHRGDEHKGPGHEGGRDECGRHEGGPKNPKDPIVIGPCQTDNHGALRSLIAKVQSAMRADDSTQTAHRLEVLSHKLDSPGAEKHAGACLSELKDIVDDLMESS